MGPYSHLILAAALEPYLKPADRGDYYWGSVVPDIRHLARMRREQTHLGQDRLRQLAESCPHLSSFLLGYQAHCLTDQVDFTRLVLGAFPLNLLRRARRREFSQQQVVMLVEMVYLRESPPPGRLSGSYNEVLAGLGVTPEQSAVFHRALQSYFDARSLDAALSAFQEIGMVESDRLEKYLSGFRSMKNRRLLIGAMMLSVKNARLEQQVARQARADSAIM